MPNNCEHALTEILDTAESENYIGEKLVSKVEACVMCGCRRTVREDSSSESEGPWEPFRLSVTPDPFITSSSAGNPPWQLRQG